MIWVGKPDKYAYDYAMMYFGNTWLKEEHIEEVRMLNNCEILFTMDSDDRFIFNTTTTAIRKIPNNPRELDDDSFTREFGLRFYSEMVNKNMSVHRLSDETGISERTIYRYINMESTPSMVNVHKIVRALRCDVEDLLPIDY